MTYTEDQVKLFLDRSAVYHVILFGFCLSKVDGDTSGAINAWNRASNYSELPAEIWNRMEMKRAGLGRIN